MVNLNKAFTISNFKLLIILYLYNLNVDNTENVTW